MLFNRIKNRVSSATVISTHKLPGWKLIFNKKSIDGSSKANIEQTNVPKDEVWGVLHRLDISNKEILDKYEFLGEGYHLEEIGRLLNIADYRVFAYVATDAQYLTTDVPYDWYLQLVLCGARENNFNDSYVEYLSCIPTKQDSNDKRRNAKLSLLTPMEHSKLF